MEWINVILQGVLVGGLYAMFAAGLSLIFGVMRLVNIAHGDLIVLAAYVALVTTQTLGIGPLTSLIVVVPLMALIGYALQWFVLNRTLGDDLLPPLLVTFGLSVIIQNGLLTLFTADSLKLQAGDIEVATIRLAEGVYVGVLPLLQFAVAVAVIAGLQFVFYRTALGRAFRATADDPAVAQLMGLDNRHVFALAMALSLAVVAIAGVFLAVRANFDPSQGPARLIFGFEAVIIGGLGSLWGTLAGGLILGVAQAIGAHLNPGWQLFAGHIAFLVVLAVRPQGLFPKVRRMSVARRLRQPVEPYRRCALRAWRSLRSRRRRSGAAATICNCCRKSTPMWRWRACGICSPAMPASSRSASRPMSGSAPICCLRFAILGGVSPLWAIPLAGIIAGVIALPVAGFGVPAARPLFRDRHLDRRRGVPAHSLRKCRCSAAAPAPACRPPWSSRWRRRGRRAISAYLDRARCWWSRCSPPIVLLLRSRYGLALKAIRDSELAARCNGIDVTRTKLLVYIVTAFGTAMVGALIFLQKLRISPDAAFSVNDWTAFVIFITVIGGIGRIEGPIVGTVVFFALRQTLADLGTLYLMMLGLVAILVMLAAPKGLWGLVAERFGFTVFPLERRVRP